MWVLCECYVWTKKQVQWMSQIKTINYSNNNNNDNNNNSNNKDNNNNNNNNKCNWGSISLKMLK